MELLGKFICSNCDREYEDDSEIHEHEIYGHEVCFKCGESHIEDCYIGGNRGFEIYGDLE